MATQNIYNMADTWNAAGTTFTAIKMNVTDTASAAASLLMDLQVGGVSKFSLSKTGLLDTAASIRSGASLGIAAGSNLSFNTSTELTILREDASGIIAQRNGVNAQASRIYNTFTDAANYERLAINWAANVCTILNENAGTGVLRDLILKGIPQTYDTTVAALPAAAAGNKGQRRHVTDANATTFASTVAGGGANIVPVFSNGTAWIIG